MVSENVGCMTVDMGNCSWSVSMLAARLKIWGTVHGQ